MKCTPELYLISTESYLAILLNHASKIASHISNKLAIRRIQDNSPFFLYPEFLRLYITFNFLSNTYKEKFQCKKTSNVNNINPKMHICQEANIGSKYNNNLNYNN